MTAACPEAGKYKCIEKHQSLYYPVFLIPAALIIGATPQATSDGHSSRPSRIEPPERRRAPAVGGAGALAVTAAASPPPQPQLPQQQQH